jgi:integrase
MGVFARGDSPYWWLYLETTHQKERTEIPIGTTTAQRRDSRKLAEDRYHQRMNDLAARVYQLPSAQPAIRFDRYADTYRTTIALRKGARRELELLKPLVAAFGPDLLTDIDRERVLLYIQGRLGPTVSARTVNREVDLLKGMLRDAVPKYLRASPIAGLKRLPVLTPHRRLLSPTEERALLAVGTPVDRAMLTVAIDTLVRLSDLLDIQRIDRRGPWVFIRDPKGGQAYEVALSPRAAEALDAIPGTDPYYFAAFRKAANPRDWPGAVRQRLEHLCAKAGVPYGRARGGLTFHWATRRTGATRLLMQKRVPLPVVQRQGNWKTPEVLLEIYSEAGREDLLKAVGQFPPRSRSKAKARGNTRKYAP